MWKMLIITLIMMLITGDNRIIGLSQLTFTNKEVA